MAEEPKVTGLSPMTGPPGTKITIRGENLGQTSNDIIQLTINGADCLPYLEWRSPKKIIARCTNSLGLGDIIVTTNSGGQGTCDVQFNCHDEKVGPTDEIAVWVEEEFKVVDNENFAIPFQPPQANEDSTEISSANFSPKLFLAKRYENASLEELKELQQSMLTQLSNRNNPEANQNQLDRATLLKSNLPVIMECLQTLERLNRVISSRDTSIDDIVNSIDSSRSRVQEFFDPLLAQRDLVQSIENAMQQNATLFRLPSAIEDSIRMRNYDMVVKDISSVLSRLDAADQEQSLVAKIHQKVTAKVDELKSKMRDQLHHHCTNTAEERNIDEVRKLISHLHRLGDSFDVWKALEDMTESLMTALTEQATQYLAISQEKATNQNSSPKKELPPRVKFVQSAINTFDITFYDILNLGRSYFDPKDEFSCKESVDIKQARLMKFDDNMVNRPIGHLCNLLRRAVVPESPKLDSPSPRPEYDIADESYISWLKETLQTVITCHIRLTKTSLPSAARGPLSDFKELVIELRVESMKRLFEHVTRTNKSLHIKEDWIIEVDDLHGGVTKLPLVFEKNVINTLKFATDTIFKPSSPNEKSILKEVSVQAEMKGLAQSLINSFIECLDNALISSEEQPAESNRALLAYKHSKRVPSKYLNRLLITICNCQFTKDQILPELQKEFEKLENMKMDNVFENCEKKYCDFIAKLSEKFCRIECSELMKRLKASSSDRELQINLMIVHSEIFLIAPCAALVESLMTSIVNSMQVELNGIQKL